MPPSLTSLTIHEFRLERDSPTPGFPNFNLTPGFFKGMTVDYSSIRVFTLLPHIKTLDIRYHWHIHPSFPSGQFFDMLHSRWISVLKQSSDIGVDSLTSLTIWPLGETLQIWISDLFGC
ncbi:hypothetical protein D9758_011649 [Tetrapyrgos nigripes]|uniref:Uncharacterized protein n=1 Tax=Tetrapyrgos nigripes TaxID=182062 RepID=A0A8H5CU33_9AGAR|nr:hypothetical protein D9758_011649 [Tetrapyrgos nigripes]